MQGVARLCEQKPFQICGFQMRTVELLLVVFVEKQLFQSGFEVFFWFLEESDLLSSLCSSSSSPMSLESKDFHLEGGRKALVFCCKNETF